MSVNIAVELYRGTLAGLSSLASTGKVGVLAWTTDSMELFVDQGTGTPGYGVPGSGKAWIKTAAANAFFTAASSAAMIGLSAQVGDLCDRTDTHQIFILTAFPASTAGNWTAISPDASITGVTGLSSATSNDWVSYIDTGGTQHLSQPAFSNLSGSATAAQVPALSSLTGTITSAQLPTTIGAGSNLTSIDSGTF